MDRELYNTLAALLSYPEPRHPLRGVILSEASPLRERAGVAREQGDAESKDPYAARPVRQSTFSSEFAAFAAETRDLTLHDLQELFIQTFDLSPVCSLEMGWHLFGENYDRGLLLVKMRQQLRAHEVPETTELPDHLTNALRLIPCMERDHAAYFVEAIVLPALEKMIEAFSPKKDGGTSRVEQGFSPAVPRGKEKGASAPEGKTGNPYIHVLLAARHLLQADFPEIQFAAAAAAGGLRVLA